MNDSIHTRETHATPSAPNTIEVQRALESIEEDLTGTIEGWFSEVEERLTELQEVLRSAPLRKALGELSKLKTQVTEKVTGRVADARAVLELHDNDVIDALEVDDGP